MIGVPSSARIRAAYDTASSEVDILASAEVNQSLTVSSVLLCRMIGRGTIQRAAFMERTTTIDPQFGGVAGGEHNQPLFITFLPWWADPPRGLRGAINFRSRAPTPLDKLYRDPDLAPQTFSFPEPSTSPNHRQPEPLFKMIDALCGDLPRPALHPAPHMDPPLDVAEQPLLDRLLELRSALLSLKKDKSTYIKSNEVIPLYDKLVEEVDKLNHIRTTKSHEQNRRQFHAQAERRDER